MGKTTTMRLQDFIDEFCEGLKAQIDEDEQRWGETWRYRTVEGQMDRMMTGFKDYQDQHNLGGMPVPWLKIAGEALIGWVRDHYPQYYLGEEKNAVQGSIIGEPSSEIKEV